MRVASLFADLLSSNPVPEGLQDRGQRQERPRLAGAHNSACRQSTRKLCCHQTDSYRYLLRERSREIDRKADQHACFNNSWRSRMYAIEHAAEVALTSDRRVPKSLHLIDRLRKVGSCEALRPWKIARPPLFFPTTKWRKKSLNSVTVHL